MQHNQSTMPSTTHGIIRDHITKGEQPIPNPYLDLKGNLTIGTGFKIDTEDQFSKLTLNIIKSGKLVPASEAEKRQAYQKMMAKKRTLSGGKKNPPSGRFNKPAGSYKNDTNIRMSKPARDAKLDQKIITRVGKIRAAVGDAAWNKLSPKQKAASVDVDFNTSAGGLDGFPKLRQAIIDGDARAMARESILRTDSKTGDRNHGRLSRNYEAYSGLPKPEADRELAAILRNKGEAARSPQNPDNEEVNKFPPFLQKALAEAPAQMDADALAQAEDRAPGMDTPDPAEDPDLLGNDPVTDEPDSEDPPSGDADGAGGGPAGDAANNAASTMSSDPELKAARAERRFMLMDELSRSDGELDDILAKRPQDLTEFEAKTVMRARMALPSGPEQRGMAAFERAFYENAYGTGPARLDATGRMIDAPPRQPFPTQALPATTPDGEPLTHGVRRIAGAVSIDAERDGKSDALKALQTGINLIGSKTQSPPLRVDGLAGPRTRRALRIAAARSGTDMVADGVALGRFGVFAVDVQGGRRDAGGLTDLVGGGDAARALQSTVNGLGRRDAWLRLDGRIGPKTTSAFASTLAAAGADRLTRRFGETLGLFEAG